MSKAFFFAGVSLATIINAWLVSKPNLLGKLGLIIYKVHFLKTFPRALPTVSVVVVLFVIMSEVLRSVRKAAVRNGLIVFTLFALVALEVKTALDFQTWTLGHIGWRLRYGAYLLPVLLMFIISSPWWVKSSR